ncbi:SH3 domain-containing protein [Burkholderia cenocepacia]|uniref:SH3 domain-containing protein n=1 Tax=Burkholderia cenocepacia TaxID=95486 RepID=UPI000760DF30|nr:SH3 domain-containing protein [Burkholderia cenocepacia]KWU26330.1 hypothetical protein AS149_25410 [Burkholderia cenocepacia]
MLKLKTAGLCIALAGYVSVVPASAAAPALPAACQTLAAAVGGADNNFRPPLSGKVIGVGRLHLHTAPSTQCAQKDIFIIPGDSVKVYEPYRGWYQIMYVNGKSGDDFEGWVDANRIRLSDARD